MSTPSNALLCITRTASATLSALRFVTAAGGYPTAGGTALGVTRTSAVNGDLIPVDVLGTTVVESGGAVAVGPVKVDATGRVLTHDATNVKVGLALNAVAAAGQQVEVLLIPNA